jgi:hypothetical protein
LNDPGQHEAAIQAAMSCNAWLQRWSIFHRSSVFHGWLQPVFHKLTEEHSLTEAVLAPVIAYRGVVPLRHEKFCVRGLAAGFRNDFLVAKCLLVRQIKNSLRWVCQTASNRAPGSACKRDPFFVSAGLSR